MISRGIIVFMRFLKGFLFFTYILYNSYLTYCLSFDLGVGSSCISYILITMIGFLFELLLITYGPPSFLKR